ncbi:MAG: helix-turn-helix transcriptional regulator [Clostridia bacterium]|nr:helix-turn-helix transcriptional regulator [Clostridia bacterium]
MGKYERIRNLREDRDMTQKQIADILFMQLTQYRRYESGERELPLDLAISLSRFYNVPVDYIAGVSDKITISEETLTADEKHLIESYRNLPEKEKTKLIKISDILK